MSTPQGQHPGEPAMRASDDDRAATVRVLQEAVVRGLLTTDEGGERMAAAWRAVHRRDLVPLTADLPPASPVRVAPGWGALAALAAVQVRTSLQSARSGRLTPAQIALVVAAVLLVAVVVGSLVGDLLFDGDGPGRGADFDD